MDTFGRVDGKFGRKLTIDLPNNGGRTTAAFYFVNGGSFAPATVLPAMAITTPRRWGALSTRLRSTRFASAIERPKLTLPK